MSEVRHRSRPAQPVVPCVARATVTADHALAWADRGELAIVYRPIGELRGAQRNARTHSKRQIQQIAASIREFGFVNPLLTHDGEIVAGHGGSKRPSCWA